MTVNSGVRSYSSTGHRGVLDGLGCGWAEECWNKRHSKHAGSDPEAFWSRPVMAITASVQPGSGRILYAGSGFPHPLQFRFYKEGMGDAVQNRPGSDLDGLARVWLHSTGLKGLLCRIHLARFLQVTTGPLSVSHF